MTYDHIDRKLLAALRRNSHRRISTYTKEIGVPKSTLHQRLVKLYASGLRCTPLLNWQQLGLPLTVCMYAPYSEALLNQPYINTAKKLSPHMLYVECLFANLKELEVCKEQFRLIRVHPIIEVLKQEGFIPEEEIKKKNLEKAAVHKEQRNKQHRYNAHEFDHDVE
jgi:DNA-binding Lrp family transcriptional regulator